MTMSDASSIPLDECRPESTARRQKRAHRPYLARRLAARSARFALTPDKPSLLSADSRALTDDERRRQVERVARVLVRTINSCPAPGIAPLRVRDWILIGAAVAIPYLLVFGLAALASPR